MRLLSTGAGWVNLKWLSVPTQPLTCSCCWWVCPLGVTRWKVFLQLQRVLFGEGKHHYKLIPCDRVMFSAAPMRCVRPASLGCFTS